MVNDAVRISFYYTLHLEHTMCDLATEANIIKFFDFKQITANWL